MMIGQELAQPSQRAFAPGDTVLQINGLSLPGAGAFGVSLQDISFRLRAGEILGIAGVAGNGQDELLLALSGERRVSRDMIRLGPAPVGDKGPNARAGAWPAGRAGGTIGSRGCPRHDTRGKCISLRGEFG